MSCAYVAQIHVPASFWSILTRWIIVLVNFKPRFLLDVNAVDSFLNVLNLFLLDGRQIFLAALSFCLSTVDRFLMKPFQ